MKSNYAKVRFRLSPLSQEELDRDVKNTLYQ